MLTELGHRALAVEQALYLVLRRKETAGIVGKTVLDRVIGKLQRELFNIARDFKEEA